jgi:hypothetical protein
VPGMNSGLNPAGPTLVAAFRSALLHQGAIALIIIALLWLLWATARTWRYTTPARHPDAEQPGRPGNGPEPAAAGQWSRLTTLAALAASAPGRSCGLVALNAVSFGRNDIPMAAGSCLRRGVAGVFAESGGTWQAAGPALPAGFGGDQVQVLGLAAMSGGAVALLLAGKDLLAAVWRLAAAAWAKVQVIRVPIEYGSSS